MTDFLLRLNNADLVVFDGFRVYVLRKLGCTLS